MPRTFSLRLMLAGVTLAGGLFGLAVNRPDELLSIVQDVAVVLPAIACALTLAALSPKPRAVLLVSYIGIVGTCLLWQPATGDSWICVYVPVQHTWWSAFEERLQTQGLITMVAAAFPGLIAALAATADAARQRVAERAE